MNLLLVLLICSFFEFNNSWRTFHRGRGRFGNLGAPLFFNPQDPQPKIFSQKLDHFTAFDLRTWKQRYFEVSKYYEEGGPFFLMIGGEAEASPYIMINGAMSKYAKKYRAHCFLLEHRFYGKSHPTDDLSVKNLAYLNSEQALADVAFFISSINNKFKIFPQPKWIVFGGSYSGSLAAWMRLKYPHLVHGAVSSSGPLLALPDFQDYYKVVKESLESYDSKCTTAIKKGTNQISSNISYLKGRNSLLEKFKLCDELDVDNEKDIQNFFENLASNFAGIVQYNKDNRIYLVKPLTIDEACDIMLNESYGSEMDRLAEVNAQVLFGSNEKCLDFKYDKMIKEMRNVSWDAEVAEGMRQWTYQTCTEFGFFQSSDLESTKEIFGDKFPVEFFIKQCEDIFGSKFGKNLLEDAVQRTNMIYGGLDDQADNVVYIHGSIDPWHALGITRTLRESAPAIYINGTAHCANIYPSSDNDLPELVFARQKIEKIIGDWLDQ